MFLEIYFGRLFEDRVLHKEAWVATLLGTHLSMQDHKKVKISWLVIGENFNKNLI